MLEVPIIQGGMGVGVSLGKLAGAVMAEGGMGVISAAHPGYGKAYFWKESIRANCEALMEEAKKARALSKGKGLLGVNIMVASKDYATYVRTAVKAGFDAIISGAGLPLSLPEYVENSSIKLAPIVSSSKAAQLIMKVWDKRYKRMPDFMVIEGHLAGGHLGFKKSELETHTCQTLDEILSEVLDVKAGFEKKYSVSIPVFVAGGVYTSSDIRHFQSLGATGVQIGTRFIATEECDADIRFKEAIINCTEADIKIVKSPTGFPGRALKNKFVEESEKRGNICVHDCIACLIPCNPTDTPYCITRALINAVQGNLDEGLIFVGQNASRIHEMTTVHTLMEELRKDCL